MNRYVTPSLTNTKLPHRGVNIYQGIFDYLHTSLLNFELIINKQIIEVSKVRNVNGLPSLSIVLSPSTAILIDESLRKTNSINNK